jgi:hypothetical protein
MGADPSAEDPLKCQYRGYRNPPDDKKKYDLSPQYWHVFAARLAFVVVFEVMSRAYGASDVHTIQISSRKSLKTPYKKTQSSNVVEFSNFKIKQFLKLLLYMQG